MLKPKYIFIALTFFATIAQGIWFGWLKDDGLLVVDLPIVLLFIFGKNKLNLPPKTFPFLLFAGLFMLWSHIGYLFAPNKLYLWQESVMNLRAILMFVVIISFVNSKEELQNVLFGFAIGAAFQGIIAMHQWLRGPVGLGFLGEQPGLAWQAQGTFVHASVFGMYISLLTIINYRLAVFVQPKFHKFYVVTFFIGVIALYASYNRATWLAFACSMLIMFIVDTFRGFTRERRSRKILLLIGLIAVIGAARYGAIMVDRFSDAEESMLDDRSSSRKSLALDALRIIQDHPVVGVGLNNYREYVSKETAGTQVVHCSYLLIAAELGWPGMLLFISVLFSAGALAISLMRSKDLYLSHIAAALFTALMSFSIAILPSPDYRILYVKTHIWMIMGLIIVVAKLENHLKNVKKIEGHDKTPVHKKGPIKKFGITETLVPNIGRR